MSNPFYFIVLLKYKYLMNINIYLYTALFYFCIKLFYLLVFKLKKIEIEETVSEIVKTSIIELIIILIFFGSCLEIIIRNGNTELNIITLITGILSVSIIPVSNYIIQPIYFTLSNKLEKFNWKVNTKRKYNIYISDTIIYNAYATGVLPFSKSIIIGRKLTEELQIDELNAILLHEVGHLENNHLQKTFFYSLFISTIGILTGFMLFPFYKSTAHEIPFILGHTIFFFCVMMIVGTTILQRKFELEADKYSAVNLSKDCIIKALKKLDTLTNGEVSRGGLNYPNLQTRINSINNG